MTWPGRRQRVLKRIEDRLLADDPQLCSLFAVFALEVRDEAAPPAERIESGMRHMLRRALTGRGHVARNCQPAEPPPTGPHP